MVIIIIIIQVIITSHIIVVIVVFVYVVYYSSESGNDETVSWNLPFFSFTIYVQLEVVGCVFERIRASGGTSFGETCVQLRWFVPGAGGQLSLRPGRPSSSGASSRDDNLDQTLDEFCLLTTFHQKKTNSTMLNLHQYSEDQQQQQPSRNKRTKSITQNSLNKNKKLRRRTSSIYSNKAMITTTATTTESTTETITSPIPSNSSSSPSSCKNNTPKNSKKMQTESKNEKFKLPPLNYHFSSSLSMIHQRKTTSLLRTRDKTKAVTKKLQTLVALAANPSTTNSTNQQLALVRKPHNHSLAIAQVLSIFDQGVSPLSLFLHIILITHAVFFVETAKIKSFQDYQDHIQQLNGTLCSTHLTHTHIPIYI
jgi:hypothetical protein